VPFVAGSGTIGTDPGWRSDPEGRRTLLRWAVALLLSGLLVFAASALAGYRLAARLVGTPATAGAIDSGNAGAPTAAETPNPPDVGTVPGFPPAVLLIGVDARQEGEPCRSDAIIAAFFDREGKRVDLLSVPRDTYAEIPGYGKDKINHAHAYGGPGLLLEAVNAFLGTRIDKYVEVDFRGFVEAVDALGGVDIEVEKRMYYPEEGIDLQSGLQHLDGRAALGYVRFRHDPQGDITRIERQQKFLKAMLDQALKLYNLPRVPYLVAKLSGYFKTNLSFTEMVGMALFLRDIGSSAVVAHTVPGKAEFFNGASYWVADRRGLKEVLHEIPYFRQQLGGMPIGGTGDRGAENTVLPANR